MKAMRVISISAVFVFFIFFALIISILSVDPQHIKPALQNELAKKSLYIELKGNLKWRLWPNLGVELSQAALFDNEKHSGAPLMSIDHATLNVALLPLLKKRIHITSFNIYDANLRYSKDRQGHSNWSVIGSQTEKQAQQRPIKSNVSLAIDTLAIKNSRIIYTELSSQEVHSLIIHNLQIDAFNTQNNAMQFVLNGELNINNFSPITFTSQSTLRANERSQSIDIMDIDLHATGLQRGELKLIGNSQFDLKNGISNGNLKLTSPSLRDWIAMFDHTLTLHVQPEYLRPSRAHIDFVSQRSSLKVNTDIAIDDTNIKIELYTPNNIDIQRQGKTNLSITATSINLDHYLPMETQKKESKNYKKEATALPLEKLKNLNIETIFTIDEIVKNGIATEEISGHFTIKDKKIHIEHLNATIQNGSIESTALFNMKTNIPKLNYDITFDSIDIGFILSKFTDNETLQGKMTGGISGISKGDSIQSLSKNSHTIVKITTDKLFIQPINLTKMYCEANALIDKKEKAIYDWKKQTDIQQLSMTAGLSNNIIDIKDMSGVIENIFLSAKGSLDIDQKKFDIPIKMYLSDKPSAIQTCKTIDASLINRTLPFRCKGSIYNINNRICLPDFDYIEKLARDRLDKKIDQKTNKLKNKIDKKKEKVEDKLEKKAKALLKKHISEEDTQKLKELFK